jgi:hypothetical protein
MTATTVAEAGALTLEMEPADTARSMPVVQQQGALAAPVALSRGESFMLTLLERGLDFDKIERAMDLKDRMDRRDAEISFNAGFSAFKAEAVEIIKAKQVSFKNGKGTLTEYMHAELSDVLDAVTPSLSKHGLSISWKTTKQERNWVEVTCTLRHVGGHSESVTLGAAPDESGGKNSIQAIGSAITYLERYTAKAILGVAEKGQDDDGRGTGTGEGQGPDVNAVGNALCDSLLARLEKCGTDEEAAALWSEGSKALAEAKRQDLYNEFKDCVVKHRRALKNGGAR